MAIPVILRCVPCGQRRLCASLAPMLHGKKNGLDESAHFLAPAKGEFYSARRVPARLGSLAGAAHARIRAFSGRARRLATMGFLSGKRLLITGVLNNRSIAYGIACACRREGAELAFSYQGERFKDRIAEYAAEFGSTLTFECDVADDAQIGRLFGQLGDGWDGFDGFVHAIAYAPREAIAGDFLDGMTRENFRIAH